MVRTNQGGSILSFVIIGVVLTSLLVGGVYIVHQRADARVAVTQPTPADKTTTPATPGDNAPVATPGTNQTTTEPTSPDATSSPTPTPTPSDQTPTPTTLPSGSTDTSSSTPPSSTSTPATALPHTGPAETLGSIIIMGVMTVAVVSYVRSRRLLATL